MFWSSQSSFNRQYKQKFTKADTWDLSPLPTLNFAFVHSNLLHYPFSIIPKTGRIGKIHLLQNFSFPHTPFPAFPHPSINSCVNSDDFPCTWGTFDTITLLMSRLPPRTQAAVWDVAEEYCSVPLHPLQWPTVVARVSENSFCIDTCACFGAAPASRGYGHITDTGTNIFCANGIDPMSKWVDDHVFFRLEQEFLNSYNAKCFA